MLRPGAIALAAALALSPALAGCGSSDADDVRDRLEGFADATAARDYQALCDDYFSPRLVTDVEQAGLPCESAIRPELSATREPRLHIRSVRVEGDRAFARIRTEAANQPPSEDTIALVRERGDWRIASLASPGPEPPPAP